jgi:gamma-glutamyltranspeptidase
MEKEDGRFHLLVGGSGGSRIFGAVVQAILGVDWGMDISSAIEQPRVHHQLFPQELTLETTISNKEVEALRAIGHHVVSKSFSFCNSLSGAFMVASQCRTSIEVDLRSKVCIWMTTGPFSVSRLY